MVQAQQPMILLEVEKSLVERCLKRAFLLPVVFWVTSFLIGLDAAMCF